MAKRLMSMSASDIQKLSSRQLLEAIRLSEGRVMAAETVSSLQPLLYDVSNAELASAMSADILILNVFDVDNPLVQGLVKHPKNQTIKTLKKLTGRVIGINLEPVENLNGDDDLWKMSKGRIANGKNALKAKKQGVDIIVITGNPGNHVSNKGIVEAIKDIRKTLKNDIVLITGKMHASGEIKEAGENIISKQDIKQFVDAGADIILLPAPGTIPGMTLENIHELISYTHSLNKLTMTSIGTSQEGSDTDTIKTIALNSKMAGADIHHIGDSGYLGMAIPENIMAYSIAIRGVRHTYYSMAKSINR